MEISAIIDGILECKESTGMTFQQIADRADQPKSTVTRILRKETPNPSMKTLMDIAVAVGYEIDPIQPAALKDSTKDAYIAYLQQALEVERLSRKADVAEQKALRHQVVAEKNRTIFLLSIALIAFATPLGMNTIVFPASYGGDTKTGASMAMISHVLSVATIPLMYYLFIILL